MIRDLIREKFGVHLSEVSVGRMLRKLGLSPQKPLRRAYERNPAIVESWRKKEFPKIRRLAKKERATLYFSDEAGPHSKSVSPFGWHSAGQPISRQYASKPYSRSNRLARESASRGCSGTAVKSV